MRRTLGILVAALLCAGTASMPASPAHACSCQPAADATIALNAAHTVFEGRVVQSNPEDAQAGAPPPLVPGPTLYRFEVLRSWKGEPATLVTIRTPGSAAACGRSYDKGSTYLVYASQDTDGLLFDNLCSRTRKAADAESDFKLLDAGPTTAPSTTRAQPTAAPKTSTPAAPSPGPASSDEQDVGKPGCSLALPPAPSRPPAPWVLGVLVATAALVRRKRN